MIMRLVRPVGKMALNADIQFLENVEFHLMCPVSGSMNMSMLLFIVMNPRMACLHLLYLLAVRQ